MSEQQSSAAAGTGDESEQHAASVSSSEDVAAQPQRIFFSSQSDLPNNVGRTFIFGALQQAVSRLNKREVAPVQYKAEQGCSGAAGAPNVAQLMLRNIDGCSIYVADMSLVHAAEMPRAFARRAPNPNVMFEVGYAFARHTPDRCILLCNTAYGQPEELPFDMKQHRLLCFHKSATPQQSAVQQTMAALKGGLYSSAEQEVKIRDGVQQLLTAFVPVAASSSVDNGEGGGGSAKVTKKSPKGPKARLVDDFCGAIEAIEAHQPVVPAHATVEQLDELRQKMAQQQMAAQQQIDRQQALQLRAEGQRVLDKARGINMDHLVELNSPFAQQLGNFGRKAWLDWIDEHATRIVANCYAPATGYSKVLEQIDVSIEGSQLQQNYITAWQR